MLQGSVQNPRGTKILFKIAVSTLIGTLFIIQLLLASHATDYFVKRWGFLVSSIMFSGGEFWARDGIVLAPVLFGTTGSLVSKLSVSIFYKT